MEKYEYIADNKGEKTNLLVNLIISDEFLTDEEKKKALRELDNNNSKYNVEYEINQLLGKRLSKQERRVLHVLRHIIYQMIKEGEIIKNSYYEAKIPLSKVYDGYGLKKFSDSSYDSRQRKVIEDILFGFSTKGLHEDILFKYPGVERTRYILKIKEVNDDEEQRIGIIVTVPHFLFVSPPNVSNFYYQNIEGFKRFIEHASVVASDKVFNMGKDDSSNEYISLYGDLFEPMFFNNEDCKTFREFIENFLSTLNKNSP